MKKRLWNENSECAKCGKKLVENLPPYREYNEREIWTGKWICKKCYTKEYLKTYENFWHSILKPIGARRTGNQDKNHPNYIGDRFEELTSRWRGVQRLGIVTDNYKTPIDHTRDSELGIIQTRGRLDTTNGYLWLFGNLKGEWKKEFDYLICYCADKEGKIIERIYIIPKKEIVNRTGFSIIRNHININFPWYEEYRVNDEEELKKVNKIWKELI